MSIIDTSGSKMTNFLQAYGEKLLALGYDIVPIPAGTKACTLKGWPKCVATLELISDWASTHSGCGIRGPNTVGVDFDIYDAVLVKQMTIFTHGLLGFSPIRVGRPPKALIPYRCVQAFGKIKSASFMSPNGDKHNVEILADGQQFVAANIHPDTGRPYMWTYADGHDSETLEWSHASLPEITEGKARDIVAEFERQCIERGWKKIEGGSVAKKVQEDNSSFVQIICPEDERHVVRDALMSMSSDDRDLWQRMGHALKVEGMEGWAHELWLEWSAKSQKHDPDLDQKTWEGFHPERTDYRSVLAEAQRRGWINPRSSAHPDNHEATIERLAKMPPIQYDQVRLQEADTLGVRVSTLDDAVKKLRKRFFNEIDDDLTDDDDLPEAWGEPVDGEALLDEIKGLIDRFIVCDEETAVSATLWIAFTWFIDDVQIAPLAVITAPEKRCGKTTLLTFLGKLCRRPLFSSNISPASLFRTMEMMKPTLLLDETDTFLADEKSELRGIVNSGHTRDTAYVIRAVGEDHIPTQFSTWGAKALAGIGTLPSTIMDRAIVLHLRRKLATESVERLRRAEPGIFIELCQKLRRFANDHRKIVSTACPELPDILNDREQDNWEPLVAIADVAGGKWPLAVRTAARDIAVRQTPSVSSTGTELLKDIRDILTDYNDTKIHGYHLLFLLCEEKERIWANYNNGRELEQSQMSKMLGEFGIKSKDVRLGNEVRKGYEISSFGDAFTRYLGEPAPVPAQDDVLAVDEGLV